MIAFLKRRWVLLSCMSVLLACSVFDFTYFHGGTWRRFGLLGGQFVLAEMRMSSELRVRFNRRSEIVWDLHQPAFGELKKPEFSAWGSFILIPIWLPLSVVFGWLVYRELRWREKRKFADVS